MATNKRAATQKKVAPKKPAIAKATEPKKTPIRKKRGTPVVHTEEQIQREMQELSMKVHEEKQRKKLLAKDKKSKVSKLAEDNEDVEMDGSEVQTADGSEIQVMEDVKVETEGGEVQVTKENGQVPEVGEMQAVATDESQAGDHHEDAAQASVSQGSSIVTSEGAVREGVSVNKPEVPTAQMFAAVGNVEMAAPFAANIKKVHTSRELPTPKTATRKAQEDFEKLKAEEDFMEFSNILQQEVAGPDSNNQYPKNIFTMNSEIGYMPKMVAFPPILQDQRSPSTRPQSQQSPMGRPGRGLVPLQVAQLRGGAGGGVDPLFQYKPTQLPPTSQTSSPRSVQGGRKSPAVNNSRVNTSVLGSSATSPVASDPMGPTLHDERFINQGIASYFNGKVPPQFRFDTGSIDKIACQLWEVQMMKNPKTYEQICVLSSQYSIFKLRVLARLSVLPSWWWFREQIVTVLMKSGKWPVEDEWTEQQVKNAVELQIHDQTIDISTPL